MLKLIKSPDPILLEKSLDCEVGSEDLKKLSSQMQEVMYHYNGIGLAGPQVGVLKRIIVLDLDYDPEDKSGTKNPTTLINPKIVEKSKDMEVSDEGCLSCPGISAPVMRHTSVKVEYFDLDGKPQTIEGTELLAHCLQHEIDHLDGKTLFQTSLPEARIQLLQEYQEALAHGAIPGETS